MRKFALTLALALSASAFAFDADAAPLSGSGVGQAADGLSTVEQTQFVYLGRDYCWYPDGWHGPGFYWCGYNYRRGYGWGGGRSWGRGRGWGWGGGGGGGGFMGGGPMGFGGGGGGGFMGGGPMGFGGGGGGGGFMGGGGGPMGFGGGGGGGGFMGGGGGPMGFGGGGGGGGGGGMGGGGGGGGGMGGGSGFSGMAVSDVHAKHGVVLLGRLDNGLGFYRFSYNGSDKAYVGVMAQEVQGVLPDAVMQGADGYLRVNYDRLGIKMQGWEEWLVAGERLPTVRH